MSGSRLAWVCTKSSGRPGAKAARAGFGLRCRRQRLRRPRGASAGPRGGKEEAQHLRGGIGTVGVGVGPRGVAAGPCVAAAMQAPTFVTVVDLDRTIEHFPFGEAFCRLMREVGFQNVSATPQTFGIATIYQGER